MIIYRYQHQLKGWYASS